jgi:hypothetical protein
MSEALSLLNLSVSFQLSLSFTSPRSPLERFEVPSYLDTNSASPSVS